MSKRKRGPNDMTQLRLMRLAEQADLPPEKRPAMRKCLHCQRDFFSQWIGNRLCLKCGGIEVSAWEAALN